MVAAALELYSLVLDKPSCRALRTRTWSLRRGFGMGWESTTMETLKCLVHSQMNGARNGCEAGPRGGTP